VNIVFVPHGYAPSVGGAQAYTRGLAESVVRLDHTVSVVVPDVSDPEAFYATGYPAIGTPRETINGVTVDRLPYDVTRHGATRRAEARILSRALHRFNRTLDRRLAFLQPDAVVTLPHVFPNVEAVLASRHRDDWPVVYAPLLHENDPNWPTDRVAGAVSAADAVIALTTHERERLIESYGADEKTTEVIPPGVAAPAEWSARREEPIVLALGRRVRSKRVEAIYEAMGIVWGTTAAARLVIAGAPAAHGPDPAASMASDPRVTVIEAVDDRRRSQLIASARVVVSASVVESFGITTLEAWAHGTPVVVADTPVSRSVVRDEVDGLITPASPAALAAAIERMLADPEIGERMGTAGRARVETDFTWDRSGSALLGLLDRATR
jgi:glycosyltransferase involved in cell wall biosynthesis